MAFTFKGQQVDNINFNGQPLDRLQFNGVTVWEKEPPTPTGEPYLSNNTSVDTYWKTGYIPKPGTRVVIEFKYDTTASFPSIKFFMLFGARYAWPRQGAFSAFYNNAKGSNNWYVGDTFNGRAYDYMFTTTLDNNTKHTVELSSIGQNGESTQGYLKYDDQIVTHTSTYVNTYNYDMWIGSCNEQDHTTDMTSRCKFFSVKFYEGNTLVRNYVPQQDGRFYDTITGTYTETVGSPIYGVEN